MGTVPVTAAGTSRASPCGMSSVVPTRSGSAGVILASLVAQRGWRAHGAPENGVFNLRDSFGDLNATRARLGAVEDGATAPYPLFVIDDLSTHVAAVIAGIENETRRVDDGGRSEILPIGPEHGAGGGTRGTQNALGGIIVPLTVLNRLVTFANWLVIVRDEK